MDDFDLNLMSYYRYDSTSLDELNEANHVNLIMH